MSVMFGRCNLDGRAIDPYYVQSVSECLAPKGRDGTVRHEMSGGILLFHTLGTSSVPRQTVQPYSLQSGALLMWNGRLDNREELRRASGADLAEDSSDVAIVTAAYEHVGVDCLPKIIGDWTLSVWNPAERSLILAKDFLGTLPLYYCANDSAVVWSSLLEPLALLSDRAFTLQGEYLAGWLGYFPATHLTPYDTISSVPPASVVQIRDGRLTVTEYWKFDPTRRIRYRSDGEYEEHFRSVFGESIRRRLRSDTPILAELSGGMDSSGIVRMADYVQQHAADAGPRVDTISYYCDDEPNWDERPYFLQVEEQRGRNGFHVDMSGEGTLSFARACEFTWHPGAACRESHSGRKIREILSSNGFRVLLSGIGGDEVLGAVPNPIPELADLLTRGKLHTWSKQMVAWALAQRKPISSLLFDTIQTFLPMRLARLPLHSAPPSWIHPALLRRYPSEVCNRRRFQLLGPLPSFQDNMHTLEALRRQFSFNGTASDALYEKRYPYLDRDLMEFLFAIPPDQLLRPNQRRSLMRRSLIGIVPEGVLNRRRKAYVIRQPMADLLRNIPVLLERAGTMDALSQQLIDCGRLREALERATQDQAIPILSLARTFALDSWLHSLRASGVWDGRVMAEGSAETLPFQPNESLPMTTIQAERR
jgi:asparagine synthase (glutamine-hydrolysing)